jgi:hypothetical protein
MTDSSWHGAAAKRPPKKWVTWFKRSAFLLVGAVLAGATLLALGTSTHIKEALSLINGDHGPKRWLVLKESKPSDCYTNLLSQSPLSSGVCIHSENEPIAPWRPNWSQPHVSVYSVTPAPRTLATLRDLGDRGQEEAIRLLKDNAALKAKAWIDLQDALNYPATSDSGERDPFQFERVLVATVAKGLEWNPGDRMMWTRIFVQPINFAFAGYSVAATDNETVKIASLESTSSRKFSADLSATIPGMEGPKASVGAGGEQSVKTTADINAQYEKLGVDITRGFLRVIRESETGGDVIGNTTVALTAVTDAQSIWRQYPADQCDPNAASPRLSIKDKCHHGPLVQTEDQDVSDSKDLEAKDEDLVLLVTAFHPEEESPSPPSDVKRSAESEKRQANPAIDVLPQVPVPHCALKARVWMLYGERQVEDGTNNFYDESRQDVQLIRAGEDKADVEVMSADEVSPAVWSLRICDTSQCENDPQKFLQAMARGKGSKDQKAAGVMRNVVFADYGKAVNLAHWLRHVEPESLDRSNYIFNYPSRAPGSKQALIPFKNTPDECRPRDKKSDNVSVSGR